MKDRQWKNEIIAILLLLLFGFFINRGIEIKGLYMDDLYLWSCYGEQSFWEFVFPFGSTRFRFLFNAISWLELMMIGSHMNWLVSVNIFVNVAIAYTIYRFGKRLSGRWTIGLFTGILYLLSRMSYYQISQAYGLMESLALWSAIVILSCFYRYLTEKEPSRWLIPFAIFLYFSVCFIHERYMVLLPLFYAVYIMRGEKRKKPWIDTTLAFLAVQLIRFFTIGSISPAGTGGTTVVETFHVTDVFRYAMSQVLYLFGINAGPEHFNGMPWESSPLWIKMFVIAADLFLVIMILGFVIAVIQDKKKRLAGLRVTALFLLFIALCIGCSSVTIRVELRWIYVSMTAAWLFVAYLCGVMGKKKSILYCGLFFLYGILMLPVESFYRGNYEKLYYWSNQLRYNSLAEETYGKYGEEIFGKKIYILGNTYEMSEFTANTFFKTFDKKRQAEGTEVIRIDSIDEIGLVTPNMLIVREDPADNSFQDITDFVSNMKLQRIYGFYEDGWMDEKAKVKILAGKEGKVSFQFYYPGVITGRESVTITVNGREEKVVPMDSSTVRTEVRVPSSEVSEFDLETNFFYEEAMEQRGETHLSVVVDVTSN